jgi:sec-independent protein translocase protein TatC
MTTAVTQVQGQEPDEGKNLTILEHLQELRSRMMVCAAALVVAMVLSFSVIAGGFVLLLALFWWAFHVPAGSRRFLAVAGVVALGAVAAYSYLLIPEFWNSAATTATLKWLKHPAESKVENFDLVFTDPLEFWSTFFRVSLMLGIAMAMPVFLWQTLAFVGPGLTKTEKKWAYPIVIGASTMFVVGCLFAYYVEMPPALNFLLNAPGGIARPLISVNKYIDFATKLMMVTGFVFETPLLVMGLAKIGLVQSSKLLRWWRFAVVGAFLISAVVTPSIDPITQTLVAVPMIVLYFLGILLAKLVENNPIIPRA